MRVNAGDTLLTLTSVELGRALAEHKRNRALVDLSGKVLERDTQLREQNIGSEQDMIDAQMRFEQHLAEFEASGQMLRVLGLTEEDVKAEEEHGTGSGRLQIRAPFAGTIIAKHAVTGERAEPGQDVLLLSDLSTVWVNLAVSQDALSTVREGQQVTIRFPDGTTAKTQIGRIAPTIDPGTRTALARAELPNEDGAFRPGTFVEATISVPGAHESLVVPAASIQLVHDHPCVFVWDAGGFILREVVTGATDGKRVEIVQGLTAGEKVAAVNAFHLKAEFIKASAGDMGDHHGHAH